MVEQNEHLRASTLGGRSQDFEHKKTEESCIVLRPSTDSSKDSSKSLESHHHLEAESASRPGPEEPLQSRGLNGWIAEFHLSHNVYPK
ncbi:unnamed protein product [Protopolystoma xenopodis]|uniref:Uncharacterized protein n=1 Tax=Protopolystoma xenopodis TaxID=117903 RepID=A0A448X0Z4_9PLAT|nr:unnamed protein product [Protopolystoma xenopodis]